MAWTSLANDAKRCHVIAIRSDGRSDARQAALGARVHAKAQRRRRAASALLRTSRSDDAGTGRFDPLAAPYGAHHVRRRAVRHPPAGGGGARRGAPGNPGHRAGILPGPPGRHHRAVRGRRRYRSGGAARGRRVDAATQTAVRAAQPARRQYQCRHAGGGAGAAGRLYAADGELRPGGQSVALSQPAVRSAARPRANRAWSPARPPSW